MYNIYCSIAGFVIVISMILLLYRLNKLEKLLYQEMCDAGADFKRQQMEMEEALEKGTINKTPSGQVHKCIEREKMLNEEKRERRNR